MTHPSDWLSEHWWESDDPYRMIYEVIAGQGGDRKPRAFACLCCRLAWDRIGDRRSRRAVEAAEGYLDGRVGLDELAAAHRPAEQARVEAKARRRENPALAAELAARPMYWAGVTSDLTVTAEWAAGRPARRERARRQAGWLRDLYGNPYWTAGLESAWRTPDAVALARSIDCSEGGTAASDRMPALADALVDAGCDDAEVLGHCREPGEHVRGCWVVDLVLGRRKWTRQSRRDGPPDARPDLGIDAAIMEDVATQAAVDHFYLKNTFADRIVRRVRQKFRVRIDAATVWELAQDFYEVQAYATVAYRQCLVPRSAKKSIYTSWDDIDMPRFLALLATRFPAEAPEVLKAIGWQVVFDCYIR